MATDLDLSRYRTLETSNGFTYNYYSSVSSCKPTILFVHGFPYTSNIWRHQVAYFERLGYGCIVPDMLGYGKTDKPRTAEPYATKRLAENLMEILDAEKVAKAVVVGHDWGSAVSGRVSLFFPDRLLALVLVSIAYFPPGPFDLEATNTMTEQAFGTATFGYWPVLLNETNLLTHHLDSFFDIFYAKDLEAWKHHFTARGKFREWLLADGRCPVADYVSDFERKDFYSHDWEAATQYYHAYNDGFSYELEKDVPEEDFILKTPSLMIASKSDYCSPVPLVQSTLSNFKNVTLEVLDGDHNVFLYDVDKFNGAVKGFLEGQGIKPRPRKGSGASL